MNYKRVELLGNIAAQVTQQSYGGWMFAFVDLEREGADLGECIQPCLLGGDDPDITIWKGIITYRLPAPKDPVDQARFFAWCDEPGNPQPTHIIRCPKCRSLNWSCYDEQTRYWLDTRTDEEFVYPIGYLKCLDCGVAYSHCDLEQDPDYQHYQLLDE